MRIQQVWRSCGEVTQPHVARLPKLWRGYSAFCGEVTKSVARLPVARLPCGKVTGDSPISLESATFQLHFGFSSSFSAILHLNCIGKHIGLCFGSWDAEP